MNYRKLLNDLGYDAEFKNGTSGSARSRYYLVDLANGQRKTRIKNSVIYKGRLTINQEAIYVSFKNSISDLADMKYNPSNNASKALKELYELIPEAKLNDEKIEKIIKLSNN